MKNYVGYVVTVIVSLGIGVGSTYYILKPQINNTHKEIETIEKTVQEVSITESDTLEAAIEKVYDSVVVIEGYTASQLVSSGSGFVYKTDSLYGYILTNNHVVENCGTVKIINNNGLEVDATVLGTDVYLDIAVIRVSKDAVMSVASLGKSSEVSIGDTVFTVGSPNGREYMGTVTKGIISGLNREVSVKLSNGYYIMSVLQTDAAINPGNSGGPLVNINGEVIGINSLKLVEDEIEGMGFAIPIEEVQVYLERLESGQKIERPTIGLELMEVNNRKQLEQYKINIDSSIKEGAVIYSVFDNTPASRAGFQKNDVITAVDGVKVTDVTHFRYLLYKHSIGDTITIEFIRNGVTKTVDVVLTK